MKSGVESVILKVFEAERKTKKLFIKIRKRKEDVRLRFRVNANVLMNIGDGEVTYCATLMLMKINSESCEENWICSSVKVSSKPCKMVKLCA
jgi:hypothetical protein